MHRFFGQKDTVAEVTAQDVQQRLAQGEALLLLDVREPYEYHEAHIAGSTLIPLGQLSRRLEDLPRDRPIVAVCRSGNRSKHAAILATRAGHRRAYNIDLGFEGRLSPERHRATPGSWKAEGLPWVQS